MSQAMLLKQGGASQIPFMGDPSARSFAELGSSVVGGLTDIELAGVGPVGGGFFFAFVTRPSGSERVQGFERTTEKGVQFHDGAEDKGATFDLEFTLFGNHVQRSFMLQSLRAVKEEIRKKPGSLVVSDPWTIFPYVIIEDLQTEAEEGTAYTFRNRAPLKCFVRFRKVNIYGADEQQSQFPGSIVGGNETLKKAASQVSGLSLSADSIKESLDNFFS